MEIRRGRAGDVPRVTELARECWQRSRFADEPMSERRFKDICLNSIQREDACLLVAEKAGRVEGFLIGVTDWLYGFGKNKHATDLMAYVSDDGAGAYPVLVQALAVWASKLPERYRVTRVWPSATDAVSDPDRTGIILERLGFRRIGNIYEMRIDA